ncbi:myosin light chain kinase family member 4 isoform X3 [Lonchura striata]|uniref:myosin light chain kinase family member 4 isoform X3 n=1 Tax=Lonchura striata TaxID=40157 RepID=UPI000B4C6BB2|nr:myosin light chain kinase family member 4 isoform X3 [Lonchura striata domestica]
MTTSSRQSSSTSMVNDLAKILDPNTLQSQGPDNGMEPPQILHAERSDVSASESFNIMDVKFASLEEKIDKLLTLQDNVLKKLNSVSHEICCIEKDMEMVKAETSEPGPRMERNKKMRNNEMKRLCLKMKKSLSDINRKAEQQVKRLDGLEQSVSGLQKLVGPLVEKVKTLIIHNSSVKHHVKKRKVCKAGAGHPFRMHIFSETTAGDLLRKKNEKVIKEKSYFSETETKEKKPPDSTDGDIQQSQSCSEEEVDKLNKENAKRESSVLLEVDPPKFHTEESEEKQESLSLGSHYEYRRNSFQESFAPEKYQEEGTVDDACQKPTVQEIESESPADEEKKEEEHQVPEDALEEQKEDKESEGKENADKSEKGAEEPPAPSQKEDEEEQSDYEEVSEGRCKSCEKGTDDIPTPPAPFDHRIVSAKRVGISNYYNVNEDEILGGGRFGQVHKCEEKATGLKLAAKIIKAQGPKQKDEVKNEINVMNQLNHVNLIQLYDAFESKNDIVLVMEYVEGGELFDRIIDENYNLTEMDTISFIKQICKGIQYMHQMYILHLDLKPENILCVNREANQIKIIDFGLARRYKPREKLRVNFGTPEFLAPEVVNYEFVSFPTDMWSLGVIAYMLLTGLSPFLGDDDNETLNNILACNWDFEDEEFRDVSDEAKDFISKLLIKEKCWRLSATAALKHPWLTDHKLHSRLQKKAKGDCVSQAPLAQ